MWKYAVTIGGATLLFIIVSGIMLALNRRGLDPVAAIGRTLSPGTAGEDSAETTLSGGN